MVVLSTLVGEEYPVSLNLASSTKERWLVLITSPQVEEVTTNVCQKIHDMDAWQLRCTQA